METNYSISLYRQKLLHELERRKHANPRYSLRAFAKCLNVDPSSLSRILRGKTTTTLEVAARMASALQLSVEDRLRFLESVAIDDKRERIQKLMQQGEVQQQSGIGS